MKLSELTYDYLCSLGLSRAHLHTDATDGLMLFDRPEQFERAKQALFEKYGDVTIEINPEADWYDRIKIVDEKWQADFDKFCREKAAWCSKYGCD
jgi:hypothetical protein